MKYGVGGVSGIGGIGCPAARGGAGLGLVAADSPYHADAVHFDGTDTLSRTDALTGVVSGSTGFFSTWRKAAAPQGLMVASLGVDAVHITDGAGSILELSDEDGINFSYVQFTANISNGSWHHLMMSWNTNFAAGDRVYQVYLDDVSVVVDDVEDVGSAFDVFYVDTNWGFPNPDSAVACDLSDTALYLNTFIDLSVEANRRKFITAGLKPADPTLRPAGAVIDFRGDADNFATNRGTGGAFTLTGSLTNASTSPSD